MNNSILFIHHENFVPLDKEDFCMPCSGTALSLGLIASSFTERGINVSVIHRDNFFSVNRKYTNVILLTKAIDLLDDVFIKFPDAKVTHWNHNFIVFSQYHIFRLRHRKFNVVAVSDYHAGWLIFKSKLLQIHRIYNPFTFTFFTPSVPHKLEPLCLLFSGSLSYYKGFDVFLSIVEYVSSFRVVNASCCGELSDVNFIDRINYINNKIIKNGSSITLIGMLDKPSLYQVMKNNHFLLYGLNHVGSAETFGLSFLDAQMNTCIPLTLNRGGQYEAISPSIRSDIIFSSIEHIIEFLVDIDDTSYSNLRNKLIREFPDFVVKFNIKSLTDNWLNVLFHKNENANSISDYSGYFNRISSCLLTKIKSCVEKFLYKKST